jgi:pyruvate-ferredoxin/flavodoxin oxidoreductase
MSRPTVTLDGDEAAAFGAYQVKEVVAISLMTPASPMGEWADQWAAEGRPNLWGKVPMVVKLQSEAGVAGAVHGALQEGGRVSKGRHQIQEALQRTEESPL